VRHWTKEDYDTYVQMGSRLAQVKQKYDPTGLFFVHHGVGSEAWVADGFERLRG